MKLPFAIDRMTNMSLCEQMFQGLRRAIVKGFYKPGQTLPGICELAAAAGVSTKVSRQALARLSDIGWCVSGRGRKSVVADRNKHWLGRVLFFNCGMGLDYHSSWLVSALRQRLQRADYLLTEISAYDLKKDGSSRLLSESLKEHWDLVIEFGMRKGSRTAIEESGWPFFVLGDGGKCIPSSADNCIGQIELRNGLSAPEFVRGCVNKGVRSVVQLLYAEGGFDVSEMLASVSIDCKTLRVQRSKYQFDMYAGGYASVSACLREMRDELPDVFLFTDDHLAQGGLIALMEHGVRIPEDVRVVTHANRGFGPFWTKPLTRLEMDPMVQGTTIAKAVLEYFKTRSLPDGLVLGSEWKSGATF